MGVLKSWILFAFRTIHVGKCVGEEAELYIAASPYSFGGFTTSRDRSPFSILGVPLDMTSSFRSGYRTAPLSVRLAAQNLEYFSLRFGVDVEDFLYVDEGDVVLPQDSIVKALDVVQEVSKGILSSKRIPIFLGGEHTLTVGTVRAAVDVYGRDLCVLVFDAHADLRVEYGGSRYSHACTVSRVLETLGRDSVYIAGVRAVSKAEYERLRSDGVKHLTARTIRRVGVKQVASVLHDFLSSCSRVYLSVDMDVFDPAFAPGVATPEPEGMFPSEFFDIFHEIVNKKFIALDITEVTPPYDPSMITSMLAARVALEFMAGAYASLHA